MGEKEVKNSIGGEFAVYSSIICSNKGSLLPPDSFFNRLPVNYELHVLSEVNKRSAIPTENLPNDFKKIAEEANRKNCIERVELIIDNPYLSEPTFIRYGHLCLRKADGIETELDEEEKRIKFRATKDTSSLLGHIVPPPPTLRTAFRLFQIEVEHARLTSRFKQMMMNPSAASVETEYFCNNSLQILKMLGRQLQECESNWQKQEHPQQDTVDHYYIMHALKQYLKVSILQIQELFEPFLKLPPLTAEEIDIRYFNNSLKPLPTSPDRESKNQLITAPLKSKGNSWSKLFKETGAADDLLKILKKKEFVAEDGRWIGHPPLLTMIALYNVLLRQGYLSATSTPAKVLARAFNHQFTTAFASKKWQPTERKSAVFHEVKFNFIPPYKNI